MSKDRETSIAEPVPVHLCNESVLGFLHSKIVIKKQRKRRVIFRARYGLMI